MWDWKTRSGLQVCMDHFTEAIVVWSQLYFEQAIFKIWCPICSVHQQNLENKSYKYFISVWKETALFLKRLLSQVRNFCHCSSLYYSWFKKIHSDTTGNKMIFLLATSCRSLNHMRERLSPSFQNYEWIIGGCE